MTEDRATKVVTMHPVEPGKPLPVKAGDLVIAWFHSANQGMYGYRGRVTAIQGPIVSMELSTQIFANGRKVEAEGQMTINTIEEKTGRGRIFSHFEAVKLEA